MVPHRADYFLSILTALCITAVVLLLQNTPINQSATLTQMLPEQELATINHYRGLFAIESEPAILIIASNSALTTERISHIEDRLRSIDIISNTLSAASVEDYGLSNSRPFMLADNRQLMMLMYKPGERQLQDTKASIAQVHEVLRNQLRNDESYLLSGLQQLRVASWEVVNRDLKFMLPILVVLTSLITFLLYRSFTALLLSLFLASLTTAICLAGQIYVQGSVNAFVILVIPVIWAISTLDVFHLYSRAAINRKQGRDQIALGADIFRPCLLTTATTVGCLLTLTLTDSSPMIKTVGVLGASGATIAFVLTFTVGRFFLSRIQIRHLPDWPAQISLGLASYSQKHYLPITLLWAAVSVAALLALPFINTESSYPRTFTADTANAREISRLMTLTDSDMNPVDIIIEASDDAGKDLSALLSATLSLNHYLKSLDETRLVLPTDLFSEADKARIRKNYSVDQPPEKLTVLENMELRHWLNLNEKTVRLQLYLSETSFDRKQQIFEWLQHFDATMLSHHRITLSGGGYYYHQVEVQGLKSLLSSSLLSLLIIALAMMYLTRNARLFIVAMCASIVSILSITLAMLALGIAWSISLLPLPAILLGLMVDDSIHLLADSKAAGVSTTELGASVAGADATTTEKHQQRIQRNVLLAGPALLATTLVLAGAAASLLLSGIRANHQLGELIPFGLVIAYLCNLSLIPALSSWSHRSAR